MPTNRPPSNHKPTKAEQKAREAFWAEHNANATLITEAYGEAAARLVAAFGDPVAHTVYAENRDEMFVFVMANGKRISFRVTW